MARAVREREVSAVELVEAHAARIAERNPEVNAIVLGRGWKYSALVCSLTC